MRFAVIACVALSCGSVRAELITVTYTGTIWAAVDDSGQDRLAGKIDVGMPWTASFTIDSNAPDLFAGTPAEGHNARYQSATNLVVTIGTHATITGPVAIFIHNEGQFGSADQWSVRNEPFVQSLSPVTMTVDGVTYPHITHTLHLSGPTGGAGLSSNLLVIPNVSDGIWKGWGSFLVESPAGLRVYGTVETLNGQPWVHPTPEPSTIALAMLGAAMLVVWRRRAAVHSQPSRTPNE